MYSGPVIRLSVYKYGLAKRILNSVGMRYQFPGEYTAPRIIANFPGENHVNATNETQNGELSAQRFVNFRRSYGSYIIDTDGNTVLDLNASSSGQILGYNN